MIWAIEQKFCFVKVTLNKKMGSVYNREEMSPLGKVGVKYLNFDRLMWR